MKWKIHIVVIAIITMLILVMYALFKPEREVITIAGGDNPNFQLRIESASWGLNCNALYNAYKARERSAAAQQQNPSARPVSPAVIIQPDNVLYKVGEKCDGHSKCTVTSSSDEFPDVFTACSKDLVISWRCYSYDKLRSAKASSGDKIIIDCEKQ